MKLGFINEVVRGVWLIEGSVAPYYANLAFKHLDMIATATDRNASSESLESKISQDTIVAINAMSGEMYSISDPIPTEPYIGVICVEGIVRKNSYCGEMGTIDMQSLMSKNEEDANCVAHVLRMDTPGGSAANTETFARFIRYGVKKPVIAWFNSMCASAGYYIACACDEIYASQKDDFVGSVGVYSTLQDWKSYWDKQGLKTIDVYSTKSPQKNDIFEKAIAGDIKPMQQEFLDPCAELFISTVKEMRPNLTDKNAFEGKLYAAINAPKGMIDGIKTWEDVILRAQQLAGLQPMPEDVETYEPASGRAPEEDDDCGDDTTDVEDKKRPDC